MDTSISLRVNDNSRQWGGNHSPQGERQNRRKQKLEALLQSIHVGDLEAARQAFIALVNFDLSVSTDPYLTKIGAALQSSNLYAAKHFAQELQNRGGQLQSLPLDGHGVKQMGESLAPQNVCFGLICLLEALDAGVNGVSKIVNTLSHIPQGLTKLMLI